MWNEKDTFDNLCIAFSSFKGQKYQLTFLMRSLLYKAFCYVKNSHLTWHINVVVYLKSFQKLNSKTSPSYAFQNRYQVFYILIAQVNVSNISLKIRQWSEFYSSIIPRCLTSISNHSTANGICIDSWGTSIIVPLHHSKLIFLVMQV